MGGQEGQAGAARVPGSRCVGKGVAGLGHRAALPAQVGPECSGQARPARLSTAQAGWAPKTGQSLRDPTWSSLPRGSCWQVPRAPCPALAHQGWVFSGKENGECSGFQGLNHGGPFPAPLPPAEAAGSYPKSGTEGHGSLCSSGRWKAGRRRPGQSSSRSGLFSTERELSPTTCGDVNRKLSPPQKARRRGGRRGRTDSLQLLPPCVFGAASLEAACAGEQTRLCGLWPLQGIWRLSVTLLPGQSGLYLPPGQMEGV